MKSQPRQPDPGAPGPEDELAQALADWDKRLGDSVETAGSGLPASDATLPPEITPRLDASSAERLARDMDCVRLLREVWKPGESTSNVGGESSAYGWFPSSSLGTSAPGGTGTASGTPQRIGRFEIRRELGCGGYGVVFLAYDPQLRRDVALKVPRGEALFTAELRARFQHEARAAAALDHPNIVPVYDAGEIGPVCYIASAYCPGQTLAAWLAARGEPAPIEYAARLVATLADAVQHAHSRGVLHRDLKPANVLLTGIGGQGSGVREDSATESDGAGNGQITTESCALIPKITDFGLARVLSDGDANLTRTGAVLGTPQYMAPEQAAGRTADISTAADIYALGAILYELLAGQPPFRGETPLAILRKVEEDEPSAPSRIRPKLPRDLETIALKCLRKEPERRYASARDLSEDLRRFLEGKPVEARPVGNLERCRRWCRRNPWIAGLASAVVLLAVGGLIGAARYMIDVTAARDDAQRSADDSRRSLVALSTANGDRLMREGDVLGSLVWYAHAWRLDDDDPQRQALHRERFSAVLRQSPRLVHVWQHDKELSWVEYSPDGRFVVTAAYDGAARLFDAETGATLNVFKHDGRVERAYFSPDGGRIVTASHDGTGRIFDIASGAEICKLPHGSPVYDARFSPDGTLVVTGGKGHSAILWEAATGRKLAELAHEKSVHGVAFSPDGKKIATGSKDKTACVWRVPDGKKLATLSPHPEAVFCVVFNSDGRIVLTGCGETVIHRRVVGEVRMWNAENGRRERPKMSHTDSLWSAIFSPDSRYIVTTSRDKTARVWDAGNSGALAILNHSADVASASFSRDGRRLATASLDGTARIWDLPTGVPLSPFLCHAGDVYCAAFRPDGRRIATAAQDGTVRIWELADVEQPALALKHEKSTRAAALNHDGTRIVTASDDHTAKVWSLANGEVLFSLDGHEDAVLDACYSADGQWIATASADQRARLWDAQTGKLTRTLTHDSPVVGVSLDAAGGRMLALCGDGSAMIWNLRDEGAAATVLHHGGQVNRASLGPDGRIAATAGTDGKVRLWDVDTGAARGRPFEHPCAVVDIQFNGDGRLLLAACSDELQYVPRHAQVWNVSTGKPFGPPLRHTDGVTSARFSPDGQYVATVSEDWTARVWNTHDSSPRTPPLQHADQVYAVCFSADGRRVATGCRDGTVQVWDALTGHPLGPPVQHGSPLRRLQFTPDAQQLVSTSWSRSTRVWSRASDERSREFLERQAQFLAGHQIDPTGSLEPLDFGELPVMWRALRANSRGGRSPNE